MRSIAAPAFSRASPANTMKRQGVSLPWSGTRAAPPGGWPGAAAPRARAGRRQLAPPPVQPVALPPPAAPSPPPPSAAPSVPMVPAGQVALMVNARSGKHPPAISGGLHWRIYADRPDASGVFRLLREERAAAPIFVLPP